MFKNIVLIYVINVNKLYCSEKYHTKVMIEGIGSIYCDQLYSEECDIDGVKDICCSTCSGNIRTHSSPHSSIQVFSFRAGR